MSTTGPDSTGARPDVSPDAGLDGAPGTGEAAELLRTLAHRARQLELINDVGRLLAAKHSLAELYRVLCREIGRVLRRDAFFVAIWDEAHERVHYPLLYDSGVEYSADPVRPNDGPTCTAIREARTLVWPGELGWERPPAAAWGDTTRRSAAAIYAPMISDGKVIGVLSVQRYEGRYSEQDVQLCEAVANHAAVAVANAQLYERLRSSEIQFRELIAAVERMDQHCVVVTDLSGTVTHAAGTAATHGYTPEELVGRHVNLLGRNVPEAAETTVAFTGAAHRGVPWTKVVAATHRDGHNFPIHISASPYFGQTGELAGVVTIGRDLTQEVETRQRLVQSAKLASIGELVAGVAHELNNPLTVIKSTAQLMCDDLDGPVRDDAEMIVQSADRAVRIVRNLLHFARQTRPEKGATDLNAVVARVLRFRGDGLQARGITVTCDLEPTLPTTLADAVQLEQVLLNLVNNAESAMLGAGGAAHLTIRTRSTARLLRLTVTDTGTGIEPEHVSRLFDPFFTTRRVGEGTGLGLALSHGIVAEHGGSIWVRSKPGEGATFVVELPIVEPKVEPPSDDGVEDRDTGSCTLLVVDDEPGIRRSTSAFLLRRGHRVEVAASGQEALNVLGDQPVDAVLLDLRMPGLSGEETYREIRERWPALAERVVFATGDVVTPTTREFLERTGNPVFEKPYQLPAVARVLERLGTGA